MKKHKQTLKEFMEDYKGFDWCETVVLVKRSTGKAFICDGAWETLIEKHKNDAVWSWTHNVTVMVITLDI